METSCDRASVGPMNGARLDITASVVVVDDKTANGNAYGQAVAAGEAN